jgi:putative FmdB family regulatory protein
MPIYEYRCSSCGHELESLQKFSDAPLTACPACQREALVKKVSASGFQLKGSGWYVTDFKGSGGKPAAKSDKGDGKSGDAKVDSKADSKADSKSESKTETKTEARSETKSESKSGPPSSSAPAGSGTTSS